MSAQTQLSTGPDAVFRRVADAWVASNPRLRSHVELSPAALSALAPAGHRDPAEWATRFADAAGRDRTLRGMGSAGLVADHSGLAPASGAWVTGADLVNLLQLRGVLIASAAAVQTRLKPLTGPLDRDSLGTFHQRVGQHVLLEKRIREPWRAWQDQKFARDGRSLLDTPYRQIQETFFDAYFASQSVAGKRVLDFGCGNGYYTAKFATLGVRVTGMDSSGELLAMARENFGGLPGLDFVQASDPASVLRYLADPAQGPFDMIYLQDTLLLLLQPESGASSAPVGELLRAFRNALAERGTLRAMEPNAVFWLAGRYGDADAPYALVTEYRHPVFNVAPTMDCLLGAMSAAGFALRDLEHPSSTRPDDAYSREFPIWDFMTFVPLPAGS